MLPLSLRLEISQMVRESQDYNISQLTKHGKRIWGNTILLENIYFCEFIKATALRKYDPPPHKVVLVLSFHISTFYTTDGTNLYGLYNLICPVCMGNVQVSLY